MALQITCITKLPNHADSHRRIQAVGGSGFYDSEDTAIANVKKNPQYYCVSELGKLVWVKVQKHDGRDYGAVRNVVGIRCGAISSDMRLSDHAARSIG
jgi:Protein of unknown function (DUF3892)